MKKNNTRGIWYAQMSKSFFLKRYMSIFVIFVQTYCFLYFSTSSILGHSYSMKFIKITILFFFENHRSMRNTRRKKGRQCVFWVKLCQYDFTTVIIVKLIMLGPSSYCAHLSRASVVHDSTNAIPSLPEGECLARSRSL